LHTRKALADEYNIGLSKTHPTVIFRPSEIRRIPDTLAELTTTGRGGQKQDPNVMNDVSHGNHSTSDQH